MTPNMRDHCHLSSTRLSKIVQETRSRSIDPREGCVPPGGAECGLHFFVNADMSLERYESVAQSRVLRVPVVFDRAGTFELFDETGNPYFDFCSGGYGHNDFDVHARGADELPLKRADHQVERPRMHGQAPLRR
jgi:hypothetical protein